MSIDFTKLVQDKIAKLGLERSAKFFIDPRTGKGKSLQTIHHWKHNNHRIPAWAAQLAFEDEYKQSKAPVNLTEMEWSGENLVILLPTYRSVNPRTAYCINVLMKKYHGKVTLYTKDYTGIIQSRNILATQFVKYTKAEWCLFIDDDMVVPVGSSAITNGKWDAKIPEYFANMDIISRLLSHKVDIVSALCCQRTPERKATYHKALVMPDEAVYARNTPKDELRDAGNYVGMAATLIHRRVFEAIEERFPDIVPTRASDPFMYFTPNNTIKSMASEDISFCLRAKACGFKIHVDLGCVVGHEGMHIYWPHG